MRKLVLFTLLTTGFYCNAQEYKTLIANPSINFYEVCESAEEHFKTIDKTVKGSGWKGYQRWKHANEAKYFPSGDRSQEDPQFVAKEYAKILKTQKNNKTQFTNGWEQLGPLYIDSITGHYSAGLGRIEDFYVDPTNSNKIYLTSRSGGFWKTDNGGTSWDVSTDFLVASGAECLGVSPTNSDSILINVNNPGNNLTHGLYRSTDGGDTWSLTNFNATNLGFGGLGSNFRIYTIAYHPTISDLIFVGTSKGIYRSDDNLATWSSQITNGDITQINFHPTDPNYVYLYDDYYWGANQNYVLISSNAGLSYNSSGTLMANADAGGKISVSNDCPDCIYFASTNGVWKSTDLGQNFNMTSNPNESCDGFAVNDQDTSKMIYGYLDLYASNDGGVNFDQVTWWSFGSASFTSGQYIHADLRMAKCINGVYYVSTDGLLCKSFDNAITWDILSQGIGIRENYKLGTSQSNHYRTMVGSQDNGTSIKVKDRWVEFYGADGMEAIIHPLNDDWMIGSVQYGSRRRTKDGGLTQGGANPPLATEGNWEAPISYDPNNQMTIYDFRDSVWRSEDFGSTWELAGEPEIFTGEIHKAAIAENNSNIILISRGGTLAKSIDGGDNFSNIINGLPNKHIEDIAFNPLDDENFFVVYANYDNDGEKVFMTSDGGASWTNITFNIGDMPVHSLVIDHTDEHNIYIGCEIGVYSMPLLGSSWSLYNQSLPNTTVEELEIVYGSNTIKAATWGRGVWEYSLLGRNDYPSILTTRITDQPTKSLPKVGSLQTITSTLSTTNMTSEVYAEWSLDNPTFGNRIDMSNVSDSTWVSNTPLPDEPAGTKIYFKVFAIGTNNDTTETYKFMYEVKPEQYCETSGTMSYNGNVTLVDFDGINNPTGKVQPYTDFGTQFSTVLVSGNTYPISVNLNTDNGNYTYYATAWIDWNVDTEFDETTERYDLGTVTNDSDGTTTLSPFAITIPSSTISGPTKMRISCKYNEYPNSCDTGYDGEVEDYTISIVNPTDISESSSKWISLVYPNPAKDILNLVFNSSIPKSSITITDINGKIVDTKQSPEGHTFKMNIGELAAGFYTLTILNDIFNTSIKFIKQ